MQISTQQRNQKKQEEKRLPGLDYLPEEIPQFRYEVRELMKCKDIGMLYLSNYRVHFQPNSIRDPLNAKYYDVPYGFIHRIVDTPNEKKN